MADDLNPRLAQAHTAESRALNVPNAILPDAWLGMLGEPGHRELTAVGDAVNVAARLASQAVAGEVLVSTDAAAAADLDTTGLERRTLELKGKSLGTEVVSVRVAP